MRRVKAGELGVSGERAAEEKKKSKTKINRVGKRWNFKPSPLIGELSFALPGEQAALPPIHPLELSRLKGPLRVPSRRATQLPVRHMNMNTICNTFLIASLPLLLCSQPTSYAQATNPLRCRVEVSIRMDNATNIVTALRQKGIEANIDDFALTGKETNTPQGIWIGKSVPLEAVRQTLLTSLPACPSLCYVMIWGLEEDSAPEDCYSAIFLGGSTSAALHYRLSKISIEELLDIVQHSENIDEFHRRIMERNRKNMPNQRLQPTRLPGRQPRG